MKSQFRKLLTDWLIIERYCEGNREGAYYAADMMSKMIMRRLSEKHETEEKKIEVK